MNGLKKKTYMKIIYRPHLSKRLKERKIPVSYPRKILKSPDKEYFDSITNHHISIKKLRYAEKLRHMVIVYDIIGENREVITNLSYLRI